jgi:cell wall-associated NlpC family hydrolase
MRKIILCLLMLKASIINGQNLNIDSSLLSFIKEWKGTPYVLGGTTKKGIDCSGLNKKLYQAVYNIKLPEVCYKQWNVTSRVNRDSLIPGDLIFFRSTRSPSGWHCGCYLGDSMFFHAPQRGDVVKISSLEEEKYKRSYKGAGRISN